VGNNRKGKKCGAVGNTKGGDRRCEWSAKQWERVKNGGGGGGGNKVRLPSDPKVGEVEAEKNTDGGTWFFEKKKLCEVGGGVGRHWN